MRNAATWTILACAAYVALDVKTNNQPAQPAITFERDRDESGLAAPFVVQIDDLASDVVQSIASGCECNCDGKCMDQIAQLREEVAALRERCENCEGCNAPRPLQGAPGASLVAPGVTLNGRVINPDTYIAEHGGYNAPHWSIANHENIANVHNHLRDHGFSGFEGLPKSKLMALHQAAHHAGEAMATRSTQPPRSTTVTRIPQSRGGCANGNCSRPTRRFRLFR